MKFLKKDASGTSVQKLQFYLNLAMPDGNIIETGVFDTLTESAVLAFQKQQQLPDIDGLVGNDTWGAIFKTVYKDDFFANQITNLFLNSNEYYHTLYPKNAIYLHHTAGNFNPKSTINWFEIDKTSSGAVRHVSTPFVIGRKSSIRGVENDEYDGKTYRCFNEIHWAHHLGVKDGYKKDKSTIGIEICAFGWLYKDDDGFYYQADKKKNTQKVYLEDEAVLQLDTPWRKKRYFEKYTEKQIAETKRLVLTLTYLFDIELPDREYNREWFDIQQDAVNGKPGLWTHVNVRKDKTDCIPQPEFIDMLNTLHEAQKDFKPVLQEPEPEPEIAAEIEILPAANVIPAVPADSVTTDTIVPVHPGEEEEPAIAKSVEIRPKGVEQFEMEDLFRINHL